MAGCPKWELSEERGGLLRRQYRFKDFAQAFAFMTEMAQWSEISGHHPEWFNVYSRVDVLLTTHDLGGLSEKDFAWACQADQVADAML
jgi:4a-hydroxytetrahydrobiopterin dehydratase